MRFLLSQLPGLVLLVILMAGAGILGWCWDLGKGKFKRKFKA